MGKSKSIEKEQFWRLVIDEQRISGLSARAFCQREGVSESCFYAWRTRLQKRVGKGVSTSEDGKLIPVDVVEYASQRQSESATGQVGDSVCIAHTVEVQTPSGFLVRVHHSIEPIRLAEFVRVIDSLDRRVSPC